MKCFLFSFLTVSRFRFKYLCIILFIYSYLAVLGLVAMLGLPIAVASLVVEHRLQARGPQ